MKLYQDKDWLKKKYLDEKFSTYDIARLYHIDNHTITRWMKKYNIPSRCTAEANISWNEKRIKKYKNKDYLYQKYVIEKLSILKIAKLCKASFGTILNWMKKFNIKRRTLSEADKGNPSHRKGKNGIYSKETLNKMSLVKMGNANSSWKGGLSFKPYSSGFNKHTKERIRKRDNYQCQLCGKGENGKSFPIHHVDYNKENNDPNNLINLCVIHNSQANYQREKWQFFFEVYQEIRGM